MDVAEVFCVAAPASETARNRVPAKRQAQGGALLPWQVAPRSGLRDLGETLPVYAQEPAHDAWYRSDPASEKKKIVLPSGGSVGVS